MARSEDDIIRTAMAADMGLPPGMAASDGDDEGGPQDRARMLGEIQRATDPRVKAALQINYDKLFNGAQRPPAVATSMRDGFPELRDGTAPPDTPPPGVGRTKSVWDTPLSAGSSGPGDAPAPSRSLWDTPLTLPPAPPPAPGFLEQTGNILTDSDNGGGVLPAIGYGIDRLMGGGSPPRQQRGVAGFAADTGRDLARGAVGLGESVIGVGDLLTAGAIGSVATRAGYDPRATDAIISGYNTEARQQADADVQQAQGFMAKLKALAVNPSSVAGQVVQALPGMAALAGVGSTAALGAFTRTVMPKAIDAAAAAGLTGEAAEKFAAEYIANLAKTAPEALEAGRAAATSAAQLGTAATLGAQTAGSVAEAGRAAGQDYSTYAPAALAAGLATVGASYGSKTLAQALGVGDVATALSTRAAGIKGAAQTVGGLAAATGKETAKGVAENAAFGAIQQAGTNVATGQPMGQGVPGAAAEAGVVGGVMSGAHGAFSHAVAPAERAPGAPPAPTPVDPGDAALTAAVHPLREAVDRYLGTTPTEDVGREVAGATTVDAAIAAAEAHSASASALLDAAAKERDGARLQNNAAVAAADAAASVAETQHAPNGVEPTQSGVAEGQQIPATADVSPRAADYADLSPMDQRTAQGRLKVLRDQEPATGAESGLNVVPHPSVPERFAIGRARTAADEQRAGAPVEITPRAPVEAGPAAPPAAPPSTRQVTGALKLPGFERTAVENARVQGAERAYPPADMAIIQKAAEQPFAMTAQERVRLAEIKAEQAQGRAAPVGERPPSIRPSESRDDRFSGAGNEGETVRATDVKALPDQSQTKAGELSKQSHAVIQQVARIFGKKLVVYEGTTRNDGFIRAGDAKTIYLNRNSSVPHLVVLGHELLHTLRADSPAAYDALSKVIKTVQGADTNVKGIRGDHEELTADLLGNRFREPGFWADVFREILKSDTPASRTAAMKLGAVLTRTVGRLVKALKGAQGFDTDKMVANLEEVRAAAVKALGEYARTQYAEAQTMDRGPEKTAAEPRPATAAPEAPPPARGPPTRADRQATAGAAARQEMGDRFSDARENNASGESAASLEAISRQAREKAANQDRYRVRRDGTVVPLIGPDAVDARARPGSGDVIVQRGVGRAPYTVLDQDPALGKSAVARALAQAGGIRASESRIVPFKRGDVLADKDVIAAFKKLGKHYDNAIEEYPWKIRSREIAEREIFNEGLTKKDVIDAARLPRDEGLAQIHAKLNEHFGGNWVEELRKRTAALPGELDYAHDEFGDMPDERTKAEKARDQMAAYSQRPPVKNSEKRDEPKGVSVEGIHYSKQERTSLSSSAYGSGMKGAEQERPLEGPLAQRIHFYVDKGQGVVPESGVGAQAHRARLDHLYDAGNDPEYLKEDAKDNSDFEQRVVDRGYHGYYNPDFSTRQGAAVLLGKRSVPVEHIGTGARPPAPAPIERVARNDEGFRATVAQLRAAELPGGAPAASAWPDLVKRADPSLYDAMASSGIWDRLAARGPERLYRNDVIREYKDLARNAEPEGSALLNVGLDVSEANGGGVLTRDEITRALADRGREVLEIQTHQGSEPTAVVRIDRPLDEPSLHSLSRRLRQDAIAQRAADGTGSLEGPKAEDWGGRYDPTQFLRMDGKTDTDHGAAPVRASARRTELDPDVVAALGNHIRNLAPDERARLRKDTAQKLVDTIRSLPSSNEMAAVAYAGRAKRGWYANSAAAIEHVFGGDGPRFAALLAALSPRQEVDRNLLNALTVWRDWTRAGRPTTPEEIKEILDGALKASPNGKAMDAWVNNSVRALSAEDPSGLRISGPKVNSFMLNLRGHVDEVTNDGWMAAYAAVDQSIFAGRLRKDDADAIGPVAGKSAGYMAMSAQVRAAAKTLTRLTGDEWTPAEVQETIWSWAKTLAERGAGNGSAEDFVKNKGLTDALIQATPDFRTSFHSDVNEQLLRDAGLGDRVASLRERADLGGPGAEELDAQGEAAPFADDAQRGYELRAARRLDTARAADAVVESERREQEASPEFKKWFGDSKVVDESGRPLVVYHGSPVKGFDAFDKSKINANDPDSLVNGFFFSSSFNEADGAGKYPWARPNAADPETRPFYLSIQNPATRREANAVGREIEKSLNYGSLEDLQAKYPGARSLQDATRMELQKRGYDGVVFEPYVSPDRAAFERDGKISLGKSGMSLEKSDTDTGIDLYQRGQHITGYTDWNDALDQLKHGTFVAFEPEQIKSAIGNSGAFDASNPDIRASASRIVDDNTDRTYTPEQLAAFKRIGRTVDVPSLPERAKALAENIKKKVTQGIVDQFVPLKDLPGSGYLLARLSKGASGAFDAFLNHGKLKLVDGVYDADMSGGAIDRVFKPLGHESGDFLSWIAGNRAERLAGEGRENLFTPADIAAYKSLDKGTTNFDYLLANGKTTRDRTLIYPDALRLFNEFHKNALDMAEKSGMIDADSRKMWEHEFYVPFYRVADDLGGFIGNDIKKGLVRQQAFKLLKGGKDKLNSDLLANTLMNWNHLIDASAKNRAAKATLEAAANMGAAVEADAATIAQMGKAGGNAVWFLDAGAKRHFLVEDPYLLTAINGLQNTDLKGPLMTALGSFKHWMTIGATSSPGMKIRHLIRGSLTALQDPDMSPNVLANAIQGFRSSSEHSQTYVSNLASGGLFHFGSMLEGDTAAHVRRLIRDGVDHASILDSDNKLAAIGSKIRTAFEAYNEFSNRGEEMPRTALYEQLRAKGLSHAEATLRARDLLDYSLQGSWPAVRAIMQTVPFMNARAQGLYKMIRSGADHPARMALLLGSLSMASVALAAANKGDPDMDKREDYDQNNFWAFKFGDTVYRIPKPFEFGAVATLAERTAQLMTDDEMTRGRFLQQIGATIGGQLNMNPIPQAVKPILDLYANKDSFSGRPIETDAMRKLAPDYRFTGQTSMAARALGTAMQAGVEASGLGAAGISAPSPVQLDHLAEGYFGWLGGTATWAGDLLARPLSDQPVQPRPDYLKMATAGLAAQADTPASRYITEFYAQSKVLEEAYGTYRLLLKEGKLDDAAAYLEAHRGEISAYRQEQPLTATEARINSMIRMVEGSTTMSAAEKRTRINELRQKQSDMARGVLRTANGS